MKRQSAAPFLLYENPFGYDGAGEESTNLQRQGLDHPDRASCLFRLFDREMITRKPPEMLLSSDARWLGDLENLYDAMRLTEQPGSYLCKLKDTYIHEQMIYFGGTAEPAVLYEMYRPNDRPAVQLKEGVHLKRYRDMTPRGDDTVYFYLGSAGSRNYGHWLTDDVPRLAAVEKYRQASPHRSVCVVMSESGDEAVDKARRDTITLHPQLRDVWVEFLSPSDTYHFDWLLFATPVSFHPTAKLRAAIAYTRNTYAKGASERKRRLYVTRPPSSLRRIANHDEVVRYLTDKSFEIIDCANLSFEEQLDLFKDAAIVIGVMGAAMTNTIFSPSGVPVIYLSCTGWNEPYFWDLADACGQNYYCLYGNIESGHVVPYLSPFQIKIEELAEILSGLIN